jgi:hydrogenase maturation protein HypF
MTSAARAPVACTEGLRLVLAGRVQGVGFRPFVQRLAVAHGLAGQVRNTAAGVEVCIAGEPAALAAFVAALLADAPPPAAPRLVARGAWRPLPPPTRFVVLASGAGVASDGPALLPDIASCPDCLADVAREGGRRHGYVFTTCAHCGPRYTVVDTLPWDRAHTAMAGFPLCADCAREYADAADRRCHAETTACPACGPRLAFAPGGAAGAALAGEAAFAAAVAALAAGQVVAVLGIGGYHLMADARDAAVVARLRARKHRPTKPLAVLYPAVGADGLDRLRQDLDPTPAECAALLDPARPIVPVRCRPEATLAPGLAPGLREVGAFLPCSPLQARLLAALGGPLVATSGNQPGEPALTDVALARARLAAVADAFLDHDRPVRRPADDPVRRVIAGRARAIRLGRGDAPLELRLPVPVPEPCLALGGEGKVTVALAAGDRLFVSPHVGTVDRPRSLAVLAQVAADLQRLRGVRAARVLVDAHPGATGRRVARDLGLPLTPLWHHHAHAAALVAEHGPAGRLAVFTWDALGLGPDGTLWGGETLCGGPGAWRRVATLRGFRPPGGERAAREPWRSACALAWETGADGAPGPAAARRAARVAWAQHLNSPATTAAGRLFDGLAALVLGITRTGHEAEAPQRLEALAAAAPGAPPLVALPVTLAGGLRCLDWAPLVAFATDSTVAPERRAAGIHASLAAAIHAEAGRLRAAEGITTVGLAGGVFQNRVLVEATAGRLAADGFAVVLGERVPCNDGGLAVGQVLEFAASATRGHG